MRKVRGSKKRVPDQTLLDFLKEYGKVHGFAPSIREICKGVGLHSTSAVTYRLQCLRRDGKLSPRMKGQARSYALVVAI